MIIPFLAYGLGVLFFKDNYYLTLGLLMAGLVPTSGMTISWTGFAKGNIETAVKMTVICLILSSLATPLYLQALMSAYLEVDPLFAGYIAQKYLLKKYCLQYMQKNIAPKLSSISTLGVLGIVFIAMGLKAKEIASQISLILYIFIPLIALYFLNFLITTIIG